MTESKENPDLTLRETEVALLIGYGASDQEISAYFQISLETTKNHIKKLHKKLGVHKRGQLVALINQDVGLVELFKKALIKNFRKKLKIR